MTAGPTNHKGSALLAAATEPGKQGQPAPEGPVSFGSGRILLCVLSVPAAFSLAITAALHDLGDDLPDSPVPVIIMGFITAALVLVAAVTALLGIRARTRQSAFEKFISAYIESLLGRGQDWLWAVDRGGIFTFSSQTSASLLGHDPADLIGRPLSTVLDGADRAIARREGAHVHNQHATHWTGVVVAFRHRSGAAVWMEVTGTSRRAPDGSELGFEGIGRLLPGQTVRTLLRGRIKEHNDSSGRARTIVTAFQPVHDLNTGAMTGVEALARFPADADRSPEHWFTDATRAGLGRELEFAALEEALNDATKLPPHLTVALNLSPEACLDPRMPGLLEEASITLDRIVLELTERLPVVDYGPLLATVMPLRKRGLRLAVDDAGSGFSSMRHILQLRPDIIKLDRTLITGINTNPGQRALGSAMVKFAQEISATIIAEGIEHDAELITARELGIHAGQGYLLGRPTTCHTDWATWRPQSIWSR